jgi:hypothetical protein
MAGTGRIGKYSEQLNGGIRPLGPIHKLGDRFDRLSYSGGGFLSPEDALNRFSLVWVAGKHGLPGLNADAPAPAIDPEFEILGTNASADDVTIHPEGGIKLETDGAAADQVILLPHLSASESAWRGVTWGTDQETRWGCRIKTGSAIADTIIWAGLKLTNTSVTATDADQAFFRYEDSVNSGKWQFVVSIGGTDVAYDTGITAVLSTDYELRIEIDGSRRAWGYIAVNTAAKYNPLREINPHQGSGAMTDATDLIPYIGIQDGSVGGAANHMYIRSQAISRKYA